MNPSIVAKLVEDADVATQSLAGARQIYAEHGIPCGCRQMVQDFETDDWHPLPGYPVERRKVPAGTLEEDMWRARGFSERSVPHLAGNVILAAHQLISAHERRQLEDEISAAKRLFTSREALRRAIKLQKVGQRVGRLPTRSLWAEKLALQLRGQDFRKAWESIPGSHEPMAFEEWEKEYEIYRDGEALYCRINGKDARPLKKTSFQKRYFSKAGR